MGKKLYSTGPWGACDRNTPTKRFARSWNYEFFTGPMDPWTRASSLPVAASVTWLGGGRIATGRRDYSCDENQVAFFQATQATLRLHCTPPYV
jgi:hypothetical protein